MPKTICLECGTDLTAAGSVFIGLKELWHMFREHRDLWRRWRRYGMDAVIAGPYTGDKVCLLGHINQCTGHDGEIISVGDGAVDSDIWEKIEDEVEAEREPR